MAANCRSLLISKSVIHTLETEFLKVHDLNALSVLH